MSQRAKKQSITLEIPVELQQKATALMRDSLDLLSSQGERLRENLQRYQAQRGAAERRIERGARRTDGRIV